MANQLPAIKHIVQLMLENRSFDQMLGFLYAGSGNRSPINQPYEGLTGNETNPDDAGRPVKQPEFLEEFNRQLLGLGDRGDCGATVRLTQ